jgi:hypothetical protein
LITTYFNLLLDWVSRRYKYTLVKPPKNIKELYNFAGKFNYVDLDEPKGFVKIIGEWKKYNIVPVTLPITNHKKNKKWTIECHKTIESHIFNLFSEYVAKGYENNYPITQLGCWVPRHKMSNTEKSLSIHAWGLAIDINWLYNKVNTGGNMPHYVVTLFKQYGFNWGGLWTRPRDPMHFQFYDGN